MTGAEESLRFEKKEDIKWTMMRKRDGEWVVLLIYREGFLCIKPCVSQIERPHVFTDE